ncbi:Permeases of the major facilitator superfamily [Candidatus Nitrosarchaeum limnium SFB1]|uniref:Permeases of the major facilitator superfamily n=1 Tax=Candidatus Nitrosarchaeum limnium SFB1 TaxID=886738 RepID=F3KMC0_9ARCH|nr:Permeases of the major facilitator superfamily [Candidatus Nitrosarchaeum limnium SFB1]
MYGETMLLPAIPALIEDFEIPYNTSAWILSTYMIAGAVATPIAGKLSDVYGRKKVLLIVMSIYSAGILAGGFADSFPFMLAARAAQGIGIAMFPIAFGIIREVLPEKKLAVGQSIFSSTFPAGATIGLLMGANIVQHYGWHATFFTVFPIAVLLGIFILKFIHVTPLPNSSEKKISIDIKGSIFLSITIISFLVGISYIQNSEGEIYESLAFFAATIISLFVFIIIEKKTESPLIDLKLLKNKMLLFGIMILLIVGLCTFMVYQTIPIMIQSPQPLGFGGTELTTAAIQMPFMIIFLVGSISSGFALEKIGNKRLVLIGTILGSIGFLSILLFHSSDFMLTVTLAVIAAGLSLAFIGGFNVVLLSTPIQFAGIALGMTLLLNLIGQSIGPSIAGMFQQMHRGTVTGISGSFPTPEAYNLIFLTAFAISLTSVVFAISLNRKVTVQNI